MDPSQFTIESDELPTVVNSGIGAIAALGSQIRQPRARRRLVETD